MTGTRGVQWPGALTAIAMLAAAAVTAFVMKTGGSATTVNTDGTDGQTPRRTVVATTGSSAARPAPQAVTVTVNPETPVRVAAAERPAAVPAMPGVDPRQIVYTVDGNQRPDDPVTVVYADETGALRTVTGVTLPWTLTVVPALPVNYVTANSTGSQLNCWITDAGGATVASNTAFGPSTTCNR